MKKYFLVICLCVVCCLNNQSYGQDIIKTKTGEEIKARVLKVNRKGTSYKTYDDPEFTTYTLAYKELSSIQKEGESKPMLFNHKLPRGYICLTAGPPGLSRPLGSFAESDYEDVKAEPGFVNKGEGTNLKFDVAFYLWKRLGLSIGTGYSFYKFNYDDYKELYFGDDGVENSSVTVNYDSTTATRNNAGTRNKWTFSSGFIGPIYSFKIGKFITQDIKARVGFVGTTRPIIYLRYTDHSSSTGTDVSYYYAQSQKTDLSYNIGTSTRIAFTKRLALILAADFVHTSPDLNIETVQKINGAKTEPATTIHYEISALNLSLGFAYQFKRKKNKFE